MRNLIVRTELGLRRRLDTLEMLTADDRILEETTRTAHNRRLRQLLLPDPYYNLTNHHRSQPGSSFCIAFRRCAICMEEAFSHPRVGGGAQARLGGGLRNTMALAQYSCHCLFKMTILQPRSRLTTQSKHHMSHNVPSLDLWILKHRITITILTLLNAEAHKLLLNGIITIHSADHILHLDSVRTDVLHSRSSDLSRNVRQILHTPKALLRRPCAEIIKDDSSTDRHQYRRERFFASLRMT